MVRTWRGRDGVVLDVAGVRFVARREADGRFALVGPDHTRAGTCASLEECEARALDVVRSRGIA